MEDVTARFRELSKLVPIPYPWDTQEYIARVAEFRGREIELVPIAPGALSGTGCGTGSGLWVELVDRDVIMYAAETPQHGDHIVSHEVGHMLLDHGAGAPIAPAEDGGVDPGHAEDGGQTDDLPLITLMPSLSPEAIRGVLRRQDYGNERERAAEIFADLVMVEATLPKRTPSRLRATFFRAAHR